MVEPVISFNIENDVEFQKTLDKLAQATSDFRIPFGSISRDWYKSNLQIMTLNGPGLYPDFKNERSRRQKLNATKRLSGFGFEYPLLLRTGRLFTSLLNPRAPYAWNYIGRQSLEMGTLVDYGIYHQSDRPRRVLPQRKFIFISGGADEIALDSRAGGRLLRWTRIIENHIQQVLEKEGKI